MPKAPINYREIFYTEVRGSKDPATGTPLLKAMEWNRVETELGTMVEPRVGVTAPDISGKVNQLDLTDAAASKISIIDENTFQTQFGTSGGSCIDYNA